MTLQTRLAIALTLLLCSGGCAVQPEDSRVAPPESAAEVRAGGKLYAQHCASCHGVNAEGGRGPTLHAPHIQAMRDADLVRFLNDGNLRRGMPSWSRLPEERRWQLVRYIKSGIGYGAGNHPRD